MKMLSWMIFLAMVLTRTIYAADVEGLLDIKEPITLKNKRGRNVSLAPGKVSAKFEVHKVLKRVTIEAGSEKFRFDYNSITIPAENGRVILSENTSGQPVPLDYSVHTDSSTSEPYTTLEVCYYGDGGVGPLSGWQYITRHNVYTRHYYTIKLGVNASLKAKTQSMYSEIESATPCTM